MHLLAPATTSSTILRSSYRPFRSFPTIAPEAEAPGSKGVPSDLIDAKVVTAAGPEACWLFDDDEPDVEMHALNTVNRLGLLNVDDSATCYVDGCEGEALRYRLAYELKNGDLSSSGARCHGQLWRATMAQGDSQDGG